jgi:hypothetical protein
VPGKVVYSEYNKDKEEEVKALTEEMLTDIYKDTAGFKNAIALEYRPVQTNVYARVKRDDTFQAEVTYTLNFEITVEEISEEEIQETFEDNVAVVNENLNPDSEPELELDVGKSAPVVNDAETICNFPNAIPCDANSTVCDVEGLQPTCYCKDNYYRSTTSSTTCEMQWCTDNAKCNAPFGTCNQESGEMWSCTCMWGFSGNNCENALVFILTIVTSFLALCFIAILTIWWSWSRRQKKMPSSDDVYKGKPVKASVPTNALYDPNNTRAKVPSYAESPAYYNQAIDMNEIDERSSYRIQNNAGGHEQRSGSRNQGPYGRRGYDYN